MIIIAAADIPCSVCHAQPGQRCTFIRHERYRGQLMKHGRHSQRVWDADAATQVANTLVGN